MEISAYVEEMIDDRLNFSALAEKRHYIKIPLVDLKRLIEGRFPGAQPWEIFMHTTIFEKRNPEKERVARLHLIVQWVKQFDPDKDLVCPLAQKVFPNLGLAEGEPIANIDEVPTMVPYWLVLRDIDALRHAHKVPDEALFIFAHDTTSLEERAKSRLRFGEVRVCCDVKYSRYQTK